MSIPPFDRRSVFACFAVLGILSLTQHAATAADSPTSPRHEIRAVRIDPQAGSVIYRLDSATGEVCAFVFFARESGEPRGCVAGIADGPAGRFGFEAVQGARGTSQSSAYRIDHLTGEICRFRLPTLTDTELEPMGCLAKARDDAPR